MAIADFNANDFQANQQSEMDKTLLVKFFLKTVPNKTETEKQGRPIFKEVEYIDIQVPGDRSGGFCGPATARYINRFPEHYKKFKERTQDDAVEGTPLTEWPPISRTQAEELKFFNVHTVEQLANMNDVHTGNFMGINRLKRLANQYIEASSQGPSYKLLYEELEKRDNENKDLKAQLEALSEKIAELDKPKPKRKRRTRAEIEADKAKENDSEHNS